MGRVYIGGDCDRPWLCFVFSLNWMIAHWTRHLPTNAWLVVYLQACFLWFISVTTSIPGHRRINPVIMKKLRICCCCFFGVPLPWKRFWFQVGLCSCHWISFVVTKAYNRWHKNDYPYSHLVHIHSNGVKWLLNPSNKDKAGGYLANLSSDLGSLYEYHYLILFE